MRSENSVSFPEAQQGGILIICRPMFVELFVSLLDKFAVSGWRGLDRIRIIDISNHLFRDVGYIKQKLDATVSRTLETRFSVFIHGVSKKYTEIFEDRPDRDRWEVRVCETDVVPFQKRIPIVLSEQGLHWLTDLQRELENFWMKGCVDKTRIEKWLGQFDKLKHQWVGEKLLRALNLWNGDRLLGALGITNEGVHGFRRICCNTARPGESGSYISNLVKRPLSHLDATSPEGTPLEVEAASEVFIRDEDENILYLEDCLTTGTEMQKLLFQFIKPREVNGQTVTDAASIGPCITRKSVQFRFGVATDLGHSILERTIKDLGMSECEVSVTDKGKLTVLTDCGKVAFREGRFWANNANAIDSVLTSALANAREHVSPHAFQNSTLWGGPEEHARALEFCRYVGRQLFKAYIDRKNELRGMPPWPQNRIDESSLGVRNLGLTVVFQHSIPRACLPLLWAQGDVYYRKCSKKRIVWEPLFPSAV